MNKSDYFQKLANSLNTESINSFNKAVIYTRVSTKEQADNNASLQTQKKYCQAFAKKKGLMVVADFGGTFESAKSDERKEFQKMLTYVKRNKEIDAIIVYSYDRFSRTGPNGAYISQQLMKSGVKTLSATQEVDPSSPSGSFQQNLYYIFSQFDNELRKDKSVTGMKERLRQGYWLYKPVIGYSNSKKGMTCDKHEFFINNNGKLIKRAFMWKLQNIRNFEISNRLESAGLKINPKRLNRIFQNPFYCGKIINKLIPGEVIDAKHPKLISEKNWIKVQDIIENNYRGQTKNTYFEEIPLKVFMKCHNTNDPLTGYIVKKKGIWYYKSRSKGTKLNINAKKLNTLFSEYLKQFELKKGLDKPFKQLVEHAFNQYQSNQRVFLDFVLKQYVEEGVSEFEACGIESLPSEEIKAPRVAEAPVAFECTLYELINVGSGNVVIGEIRLIHVADEILNAQGRIDADKLDLVGRMGGLSYSRTTERFELPRPKMP